MSGGVDSSLSAVLLKEAGFEVVGLTMVLFDRTGNDGSDGDGSGNDSPAAVAAKKVADDAGIPHYTVNLSAKFESAIIDYFLKTYTSGATPNPCVRCNKLVKWNLLRQKAREIGCDLLATGHYARIARYRDGTNTLMTGVDRTKDQSYFLWKLDSNDLSTTVFPLGMRTKTDTRRSAEKRRLVTSQRAESQEICFIPDNDYRRFLRERLNDNLPVSMNEGNIIDREGKTIGKHHGIAFYTIGQRRGLGLAVGYPVYVTALDAERNLVRVGQKEELLSRSMVVQEANWSRGFPPRDVFRCLTRIRYRHPGAMADVAVTPDGIMVTFDKPQSAITPGQSAVFYDGDIVLGGGIIDKTE